MTVIGKIPFEPLLGHIHSLHLLALLGVGEEIERAVGRQADGLGCIASSHAAVVYTEAAVVLPRWNDAIHGVGMITGPHQRAQRHTCDLKIQHY